MIRPGIRSRVAVLAACLALAACEVGGDTVRDREDGPAGGGGAELSQPTGEGVEILTEAVPLRPWRSERGNRVPVAGRVLLDGEPVAGVRLRVGAYTVPEPTDERGAFTVLVDDTVVRRYPVRVADAAQARLGGEELDEAGRERLREAEAAIEVAYEIEDLAVRAAPDGITVSGRLRAGELAPPPIVLSGYRVRGTLTGPGGEPLAGHAVSLRSPDREQWTLDRTDEQGRYESSFLPTPASTSEGGWRVVVATGAVHWSTREPHVAFTALSSAVLDLALPDAAGSTGRDEAEGAQPLRAPERAQPEAGAYYDTTMVGVMREGRPVRPVAASWPDEQGRFTLVVPAELAGERVRFWMTRQRVFLTRAPEPGGPAELTAWPTALEPHVPREVAVAELPG